MRHSAGFVRLVLIFLMLPLPLLAGISTDKSRIVLTRDQRAARLTVRNDSSHPLIITSAFERLRQNRQSLLVPVPGGVSAQMRQGLHVWIKQAVLPPGKATTVFLVLDTSAALGQERRVHLRLNADPQNGLGPRWGLSIPVFMRPAGLSANATLFDPQITNAHSLSVQLRRRDGATPYGMIEITDKAGKTLGAVHNVTLYAQNQPVRYSIDVNGKTPPARIRYVGEEEFSGQTFAQISLLPPPR